MVARKTKITKSKKTIKTKPITKAPSAVKLLSFGGLFNETWKRLSKRLGTYVGIVALPIVMTLLYQIIPGNNFSSIGATDVTQLFLVLLFFLGYIVVAIIGALSALAVIVALRDEKQNIGVMDSYHKAMGLLISSVWAQILACLVVIGGAFLFIIPGVLVAVSLSFVMCVVVVENIGGFDALMRSWKYVNNNWSSVFINSLLISAIICLISFIPFFLAGLVSGFGETTYGTGQVINVISNALNLFLLPFSLVFTYSQYLNLRALSRPDGKKEPRQKYQVLAILGIVVIFAALVAIPAMFMISYGVN